MKRFLIVCLALLACFGTVSARKKSPKSGKIENNVYTDSKYNFQLTLLENWEAKLQKPKKKLRLVLTQNDHEIPGELMQFPSMAKVPGLDIYIVKVPFTPAAFVDSLVSNSYKSKIKKEVLKDLIALEETVVFDGLTTEKKRGVKIDNKQAFQWEGVSHYTKKLGMGETIPRTYAVALTAIKNGDNMMVFVLECERTFFHKIIKEVTAMIESLKWPE
ncbi:MAG: hypothetical protein JSV44_02215 [Candidatus Zixiibacteriota bacterium]|nr:MAG: hypothetical protein JSV44_02215 [candidate division Zixibacteria bacterium]